MYGEQASELSERDQAVYRAAQRETAPDLSIITAPIVLVLLYYKTQRSLY